MTRSATKKAPTKKTAPAKKAAAPDPLAAVREDTPNPELTDLDRDPSCTYCGRDAVAKIPARPFNPEALVCERHMSRAETRGQEVEKL